MAKSVHGAVTAFGRFHNHPTAGMKFIKNFETVEEALAYQEMKEPNEPEGKPAQVYEVIVIQLAGFLAGGESVGNVEKSAITD